MKRLISIIGCLLLCLSSLGQQAKVEQLLSQWKDGKRIDLCFSFNQEGKSLIGAKGRLTLQGKCYRIKTDEMTVVCDGKSQWTVDEIGQEIYIEKGGALTSILEDPESLLPSLGSISGGSDYINGIFSTGKDRKTVFRFSLSGIKTGTPGPVSEFEMDTSEYMEPWAITDMR